MKKKAMSRAMLFILLFGIVSMFSDMTKDSAESIRGAFLSLMGASAATIGLVSGLGEMAGYSLRIVSGRLADRTRKYWPIVMAGYCLELITIPALALVGENGWIAACVLLVIQKAGKAIKKPAKDTVVSSAAVQRRDASRCYGCRYRYDTQVIKGDRLRNILTCIRCSLVSWQLGSRGTLRCESDSDGCGKRILPDPCHSVLYSFL